MRAWAKRPRLTRPAHLLLPAKCQAKALFTPWPDAAFALWLGAFQRLELGDLAFVTGTGVNDVSIFAQAPVLVGRNVEARIEIERVAALFKTRANDVTVAEQNVDAVELAHKHFGEC